MQSGMVAPRQAKLDLGRLGLWMSGRHETPRRRARPSPAGAPPARPCAECGDRPARHRSMGIVRVDDHHRLCFRCFRAERDRHRTALDEVRRVAASRTGVTSLDGGCGELWVD